MSDRRAEGSEPRVSLLIPARNEAGGIGECLHAALNSAGVDLEVVVLDDASTDGTGEIVAAAAAEDRRVRLETAPPLPPGWCGKQWACWNLAQRAGRSRDLLAFIDADVRLAPRALRAMCEERERRGVGLLSGFPREVCGSAWEAAVLPLIHFVLLGFLPAAARPPVPRPGVGGGVRAAVPDHPRRLRGRGRARGGEVLPARRPHAAAGLTARPVETTDVVDAAGLATCRMYEGAGETFAGLAKNATEGVAAPGLIGFFTAVLGLGQVLPVPLLLAGALGAFALTPTAAAALIAAAALSWGTRAALAAAYRQPWLGVALHPAGVAFFLAVQWYAFARKLFGKPAAWRGRSYAADAPAEPPPPAKSVRPVFRREPPPFPDSPRPRASAGVRAAARR